MVLACSHNTRIPKLLWCKSVCGIGPYVLLPCDVDQYYTKEYSVLFKIHTISRRHQADFCCDVSAQRQGLYQATQICICDIWLWTWNIARFCIRGLPSLWITQAVVHIAIVLLVIKRKIVEAVWWFYNCTCIQYEFVYRMNNVMMHVKYINMLYLFLVPFVVLNVTVWFIIKYWQNSACIILQSLLVCIWKRYFYDDLNRYFQTLN